MQNPWWNAQTHADRRPLLLARNRILAATARLNHLGYQLMPGMTL